MPPFSLCIVPIGDVDDWVLKHLEDALAALGARVVVEEAVPAPEDAYNPRRDSYLGKAFLRLLGAFEGDRVLGLTDRDLYMSGLRFIFGQAEVGGRSAVVSWKRLRWGVDEEAFLERCEKEARHELGHTFGLGHCADERCVMHFSNSLADTDYKRVEFCGPCTQQLMRRTLALSRARGHEAKVV